MRLVDNWKDALRWHSMRAMAAATGLTGGWAMLPERWQQAVPDEWLAIAACVVLVLGMVGRVVVQAEDPPPTDEAGDAG